MTAILAPLELLADFILPQRCAGCAEIVPTKGYFCTACWQSLDFLGGPECTSCNLPLPYESEQHQQCASCLIKPPIFDGLKAVVAYDDIARNVALRLKYGGRIGLAKMIAALMQRHIASFQEPLILTAVPLHWTRLWARTYNQSELIARALLSETQADHIPDLLKRSRRTTPLGGLNPTQRANMVRGAFELNPRYKNKIEGAHIALIDDVYTTGATAKACTKALKKAGAKKVTIFCWARVLPRGLEKFDSEFTYEPIMLA